MVAQLSILGRFIDILSSHPTDEELLNVKATEEEEQRVDYLSELENKGVISEEESKELYNSILAEYIMGIAKANALGRIKRSQN